MNGTRRRTLDLTGLAAVWALTVLLQGAMPSVAGAQTADADGAVLAYTPVTAERLVNADAEPENWLMYSGNYYAQRYSGLDQIDRQNVAGLEIACVHQLQVLDRAETTPLVVDGVMFITESPSTVIAVDAGTGRPYWRYEYH